MSASELENVLSELESIGVVGSKVVLLKPKPAVEETEEVPPESEPQADSEPEVDPQIVFRATVAKLSQAALKKLEGIAEEVQDLRSAFQELHEITRQGDADAEIQEEA